MYVSWSFEAKISQVLFQDSLFQFVLITCEKIFPQMAKKMKKIGNKAQKTMNVDGRRGEADRHVYDLKPKHLFSGKRGLGSSNKR